VSSRATNPRILLCELTLNCVNLGAAISKGSSCASNNVHRCVCWQIARSSKPRSGRQNPPVNGCPNICFGRQSFIQKCARRAAIASIPLLCALLGRRTGRGESLHFIVNREQVKLEISLPTFCGAAVCSQNAVPVCVCPKRQRGATATVSDRPKSLLCLAIVQRRAPRTENKKSGHRSDIKSYL